MNTDEQIRCKLAELSARLDSNALAVLYALAVVLVEHGGQMPPLDAPIFAPRKATDAEIKCRARELANTAKTAAAKVAGRYVDTGFLCEFCGRKSTGQHPLYRHLVKRHWSELAEQVTHRRGGWHDRQTTHFKHPSNAVRAAYEWCIFNRRIAMKTVQVSAPLPKRIPTRQRHGDYRLWQTVDHPSEQNPQGFLITRDRGHKFAFIIADDESARARECARATAVAILARPSRLKALARTDPAVIDLRNVERFPRWLLDRVMFLRDRAGLRTQDADFPACEYSFDESFGCINFRMYSEGGVRSRVKDGPIEGGVPLIGHAYAGGGWGRVKLGHESNTPGIAADADGFEQVEE